jgi:putative phage-type endonuclease
MSIQTEISSRPSWADGPAVEVLPAGAPRPDWHRVRLTGIGGSDALAALGLSPWSTPYTLWLDKTGRRPPRKASGRLAWGHRLEPVVADWGAEVLGVRFGRTGTWQHPVPLFDDGHGFVRYALCNPDRYVIGEDAGAEVKTVSGRSPEVSLWSHMVPDYPQAQAQWCMGVTGALRWYVIAGIDGCDEPTVHEVRRDDELIADMFDAAGQFIRDHVYPDVAPPADASPATSEAQAAAAMARLTDGTGIDLGEQGRQLIARRRELKATIKAAETELRGVDNELRAPLVEQGIEYGLVGDGRCVRAAKRQRSGYTVEPTEYHELREMKLPKGVTVV